MKIKNGSGPWYFLYFRKLFAKEGQEEVFRTVFFECWEQSTEASEDPEARESELECGAEDIGVRQGAGGEGVAMRVVPQGTGGAPAAGVPAQLLHAVPAGSTSRRRG